VSIIYCQIAGSHTTHRLSSAVAINKSIH